MQEKTVSMTVLMTPNKANFAGNVHGGELLHLLDQVAYVCASRYSKSYVVTLSVDQVFFKEPIHVGELVTFLASINFVGKSSMEVESGLRRRTSERKRRGTRTPAISPWWRLTKREGQSRSPCSSRKDR